uniref:Vps72/YL1 C-terminal domain-containing protein n=1 Tax=Bionectria ochroleuca TaxID=29856 RepID=A0A0B7JQM7_BIOOC
MDSESKLPEHVDPPSSSDSDSDSSDHGEGPIRQSIEWLATAREKRSTAGNRMKAMLANEEPDSDLELLFAEDDDDQGFTDVVDDASDVHMDSSSDDEDENAAEDDMEGEKELERQAREKRNAQRKRKAQEAIPAKFRKKVRIDTTTTPSPAPSSASGPGPRPKKKSERSSWLPSAADMPTRASSRQTTRLSKEQLHAQMEEREARRLKQLAQMQKKAARMEALKKPPMTQEERLREAEIVEKRNSKSLNRWEIAEKQREEERRAKLAALNERTLKGPVITFWSGTREWQDGGAARYVVMEEKPKKKPREKKDKTKGKGNDKDKKGVPEEDPQNADKEVEKKEASEDNLSAPESTPENPPDTTTPSEQPQEKKEGSTYTRNAIVYQNFDDTALKDKSIQVQILFGQPPPHPVCVITNHPARYRDPKTGLPFYNAHAYGEIRRLERGDYRWSKLLGSWVGSGKNAASGVPERFLNPNAPGPKKEAKKEEGQAKEQEKAGEKGNAGQEAVPANKAEQTAPEPPLEDIKPQPEHQQTPPNNPNPPIETKT